MSIVLNSITTSRQLVCGSDCWSISVNTPSWNSNASSDDRIQKIRVIRVIRVIRGLFQSNRSRQIRRDANHRFWYKPAPFNHGIRRPPMRTILCLALCVGVLAAVGVIHFRKSGDRVNVTIDTGELRERTEDLIDAVKDSISDDNDSREYDRDRDSFDERIDEVR